MLYRGVTSKKIIRLRAKIEHAANHSSGNIEDESRIDDLCCELLQLEEAISLT
jgi:hypothetical protein